MKRMSAVLSLAVIGLLAVACGDDDSNPPTAPSTTTSYDETQGWICASDVTCQDVFNIKFPADATVTIQATDVTGGSAVQLALYAPGVPLGDINLLTGTTNELRCNWLDGDDCDSHPEGQQVVDFPLAMAGVYRLAVTRDWGFSCGGDGTYRLVITSDKEFTTPVRVVNDAASLAPGSQCP